MKKRTRDYGDDNNRNLKLVIGLTRSVTEMEREAHQFMTAYGITISQFGVLEVLYHLGDLKICQIIEKTLSTSGNMTVVIKNLEKEALIERKQSPEDKRASVISITSKGAELIEQIFPKHLKELEKVFSRISGDEKDQLTLLLKKMNGIQ